MSKPKIYGTCPAGCLWETVHRDEFLNSASIVKVAPQGTNLYLEQGKTYKVKKVEANSTSWGFNNLRVYAFFADTVDASEIEELTGITHTGFEVDLGTPTRYDDYKKIKILGFSFRTYGDAGDKKVYLVIELDGVRQEIETGLKTILYTSLTDDDVTAQGIIFDADNVTMFLVNEDANILLEVGDSGDSGDSGSGGTDAETEQRLSDLEAAVEALNYKEITINSFSASPSTAEKGSTVNAVALSWSLNKTPTSLDLNGETLDVSATSYQDTRTFTGVSTWTLTAEDEKGACVSKMVTLSFLNGVYYGVASEPAEYNSAFILGLTKNLRSSKLNSFTANAQAGEYIYYCLPVSMGACSFKVGGFDGGFSLVDTVSFTNAHGHTENYYIYKSDNAGLGSTSVTVS